MGLEAVIKSAASAASPTAWDLQVTALPGFQIPSAGVDLWSSRNGKAEWLVWQSGGTQHNVAAQHGRTWMAGLGPDTAQGSAP